MSAPAGGVCGTGKPCWKPASTTGFTYKDSGLAGAGKLTLMLKSGGDGKAKITLSGKGARLAMPSPLAITQPVTVQLKNSSGVCWEAMYSEPAIKNELDQFKDKAD